MFSEMGKILIFFGLLIAFLGVILFFVGKGPLPWLGRLPGDFYYEGKKVTFYFPLATCLLISGVLTLIFWLVGRK